MNEGQYISTDYLETFFCVDHLCVWNFVFYIFTTMQNKIRYCKIDQILDWYLD